MPSKWEAWNPRWQWDPEDWVLPEPRVLTSWNSLQGRPCCPGHGSHRKGEAKGRKWVLSPGAAVRSGVHNPEAIRKWWLATGNPMDQKVLGELPDGERRKAGDAWGGERMLMRWEHRGKGRREIPKKRQTAGADNRTQRNKVGADSFIFFLIYFKKLFYIRAYLKNNDVLVSGIQQSDSVIHIL